MNTGVFNIWDKFIEENEKSLNQFTRTNIAFMKF